MPLPDRPEFDIPLKLTLGRLTPRQLAAQGLVVSKSYYRIPPAMTFDFLESNSPDFYEISFRVVRLQTGSGNAETPITNLDPDRFPFNFTQSAAWAVEAHQGTAKYKRHVNFSDAVFACCAFLRRSDADPLPLLRRRLLPLHPGRTAPRPNITGNRISACYASAR